MKIKSTLTKEYFILLKQKLFLQTWQSVWQTLLRTQIKRHPIMTDSHRVFKWVWVIFFISFCLFILILMVFFFHLAHVLVLRKPSFKVPEDFKLKQWLQFKPGCSQINFKVANKNRGICNKNKIKKKHWDCCLLTITTQLDHERGNENNNFRRRQLVKCCKKLQHCAYKVSIGFEETHRKTRPFHSESHQSANNSSLRVQSTGCWS